MPAIVISQLPNRKGIYLCLQVECSLIGLAHLMVSPEEFAQYLHQGWGARFPLVKESQAPTT